MQNVSLDQHMSNPSVKEIQVNRDGSLEVSYDRNSSEGAMLLAEASVYSSDVVEMVSRSGDDIVVVKTREEDKELSDYHAIKFGKKDWQAKLYYKNFWKFPNIQLPKGARLANQFGIGQMKLENGEYRYDIYFFCDNQYDVERHYKSFIDCDDLVPYRDILGLYGVTYTSDYKILNLKRYMYPFDPYCKNPDYI